MNILILDDNHVVTKMLESVTLDVFSDARFFCVSTEEEASCVCNEQSIDLALLDIKLGSEEKSGLHIGKRLVENNSQVEIVIISAYPQFALNAYAVHPFDFIVKPIDVNQLKETLEALRRKMQLCQGGTVPKGSTDDVFITGNKKEVHCLPYAEMVYLEKIQREVVIHTTKGTFTSKKTLAQLENALPRQFYRVHKSYIVNVCRVRQVVDLGDRTYKIEFKDSKGHALMSRYRAQKFFEILKNREIECEGYTT